MYETLVVTYETTWHHNPEDHKPDFQCYKNLKIPGSIISDSEYVERT